MAASNRSPGSVAILGDDSFDAVVRSDDIVLVEFYTEWCGTCQKMQPLLEFISEATDVTVFKVDIESNLETAIEFGAQRAPTFVLFAEGRPVKQLQGSQTEATLRELVEAYAE